MYLKCTGETAAWGWLWKWGTKASVNDRAAAFWTQTACRHMMIFFTLKVRGGKELKTETDLHPLIHPIWSQSFLKMVEIVHNLWEFPLLKLSRLSPSQKQLSASSFTHPTLKNFQGLFLILPQINGKFLFFNEAINSPKIATPQIRWAWCFKMQFKTPMSAYTDELNTPPVGLSSESTVQKTL